MPERSVTITISEFDETAIQGLALGALIQLDWTIKYAGEKKIIAHTPRKWSKWDDEITIETEGNRLTVRSKLIHGEIWDTAGKNKKHLADFLQAFETVKAGATEKDIEDWPAMIAGLKEGSIRDTEQAADEAAQIDKVMNFSSGNLYITYGIIAVNTIIFLLMVFNGVDFFSPAPQQVLKWGGNLPELTLGGEWWRLIASIFLHFGIIHLALNMYALYYIGSYLEKMLGKSRYITAYLCAGISASFVSLLWHRNELLVSAGASGAIFGMFGS
jgi:rhomboid protease GluP